MTPPARTLAAWLGVSERSAQRWLADDAAPRPVLAALWLASRWGLSDMDAERQHAAQTARGLAQALARENAALRAALDRLAPLARAGAANEPLRPGPGQPAGFPDHLGIIGMHPAGDAHRAPLAHDIDAAAADLARHPVRQVR